MKTGKLISTIALATLGYYAHAQSERTEYVFDKKIEKLNKNIVIIPDANPYGMYNRCSCVKFKQIGKDTVLASGIRPEAIKNLRDMIDKAADSQEVGQPNKNKLSMLGAMINHLNIDITKGKKAGKLNKNAYASYDFGFNSEANMPSQENVVQSKEKLTWPIHIVNPSPDN